VLEQENARLKKLVAERDLEIEVMKEIAAPREARSDGGPSETVSAWRTLRSAAPAPA
jgi:hypothetical protein